MNHIFFPCVMRSSIGWLCICSMCMWMHMLTMAWTWLCFLVQCHSDACYGRCYVYTCKCYQSSGCTWVCDGFPHLWPISLFKCSVLRGWVWHSFHLVPCRYNPVTDLDTGLQKFVKWYKSYYKHGGENEDMLKGYKPYWWWWCWMVMVIFVQPVSPVFALWIYLLFPLHLCFNPGALNISVHDCDGFSIKYLVRYCERKTRQSRIQYFGRLRGRDI